MYTIVGCEWQEQTTEVRNDKEGKRGEAEEAQ
jgi:hypothetical protein